MRKMWAARLPEETIERLRQLVASGRFESQSDAVAAAVAAYGNTAKPAPVTSPAEPAALAVRAPLFRPGGKL